MNCIDPGVATPEDLLAYADGDAPPTIVEHVRACPACAAVAAGYAAAQRHLRRRLYRFDCPSPQELGDYELGLLPPAERTRVAAHVVACPHCADELRTLRDFLAGEPAALTRPTGPLRRLVATLLEPAPGAAYAGLRGADDATAQTYQAGGVTIALDTQFDRRRGRGALTGLLWQEDPAAADLAGAAATLLAPDGATRTTALDDVGNFAFDDLAPGRYQVEVTLGDQLVTIPELRIGR
ncbi:MAG TPA: zf-HC2 domain-containing protein [Thermomicrobiales bacterium]|nr:zf-HC2 domain-containing protein [Thermomicrobiales bacterium]